MKKTYLLIAALLAMMAGCSSTPTKKDVAADEAAATKIRAAAAAEQRDQQQAQMESNIAKVPDWVLNPPHSDATGVYAVGIGDSDKMSVAMRKAALDAEFGLAKSVNQELSGSERSYSQDTNSKMQLEQYTQLIDKLVSQVPVVGFEVIKQEVKPINGSYNAFVLLKLPYDQFNRVLQEQRAQAASKTVEKAFDDLQARINTRRQQRIEDEKRQQDAAEAPKVQTLPAPPAAQAQPAPKAESAEAKPANKGTADKEAKKDSLFGNILTAL